MDLYDLLGLYASAYDLFASFVDKSDRKQLKKLSRLEEISQSHGDRFALPHPLRKEEAKAGLVKRLTPFSLSSRSLSYRFIC